MIEEKLISEKFQSVIFLGRLHFLSKHLHFYELVILSVADKPFLTTHGLSANCGGEVMPKLSPNPFQSSNHYLCVNNKILVRS